jgi:hypothetical protein
VLTLAAVSLADVADTASSADLWSKSGLVILAALSVGAVKVLFTREIRNSDYHKERAEKAEAEVRRLNELMQSSTLPAVTKATEALSEVLRKTNRRGST